MMKEQGIEKKSAAGSAEIAQEKRLPKYESPKIEVYKEEDLLRNVEALGCYPFPP